MRLERLQLVNFRQHADTEIAFDLGLTGIIGPNGAGKSTILEAIAWALYGGDTARGGKDSIRFSRAAPRAPVRVELDFALGGHRYRIVRGLATAECFLDGGDTPIATSATAVAEVVQRRLGMTRTEFFNTYFTGQKELTVMAALSAPERAQFLSRVLGYEKLRMAQERCDEARRTLRAEVAGLRSAMPDPAVVTSQITDCEARLVDAERRRVTAAVARSEAQAVLDAVGPRWANAQRERERRLALEADVRVIEGERQGYERARDRIDTELKAIAAARAALAPLEAQLVAFATVGDDLGRQRELAAHDGRRRALVESERALLAEIEQVRHARTEIESAPAMEEQVTLELEQKRRALEDVHGRLELKRTEWVRDRQEAETRRNALRTQYTELRDQREKLLAAGDSGICPTCARPLGDHFREVIELLDAQLDSVNADGTYFKGRLEQLEEMPSDVGALDATRRQTQLEVSALERSLAKVQVRVAQIEQLGRELAIKEERLATVQRELAGIPAGYVKAQHDALEQEFERLAAMSTQANRLTLQVEREPVLKREQESTVRGLELLAEREALVRRDLQTTGLPDAEFGSLREAHATAEAAARQAQVTALAAESERALAQAALDRALSTRAELAAAVARLDALERDRRLHDELHRAYTDLRTDLNFALRPQLSALASTFLGDLTDARYTELELDDRYRIVVLEDGEPKPVISGGEEDVANLVLRLAISQMIAERAGQHFSLLVLDEVFASLDESRRVAVIELLRRLQDRFEQVILISHIESVRDLLDRVLEVRYDEQTGAARVTRGDALSFDALSGAA